MPITQYEAQILTTAIGALPAVAGVIRDLFVQQHPGTPPPTDEQVIAALQAWAVSSLAIDDAWRAAHPLPPTV
jgi:hypothetical protein